MIIDIVRIEINHHLYNSEQGFAGEVKQGYLAS